MGCRGASGLAKGGAGAFPSSSHLLVLLPTAEAGRARRPRRRRCPWLPAHRCSRAGLDVWGRGCAWYYKKPPGHRGNELSARLGSRTLTTGTLSAQVQSVPSTAAMVAMPTAWCSVALALLVALHEGEPPWPRLLQRPGSVRGCAPWGRGAPPKSATGIQEWDPGSSGGFRASASTKVV